MQHRVEDASEVDYNTHAPPYKGRNLSRVATVQQHTETSYENTHTNRNARAHYGHVFNYMAPAQSPYMPPASSGGLQSEHGRVPDSARLVKALRFEHMNSRFATIRAAHTGTCEWLFTRKEYERLRDTGQARLHHGFLWIKGKPGTGKSTLMKSAYAHGLKTHVKDVSVSHFFGTKGSMLHRSAEGMYRSLLCQLLAMFPHLSSSLESLGLLLDQDGTIWRKEHLETLLRAAVLDLPSKHMTCYVDAIDECEYADAQDVIDFVQELHRAAQDSGMEILFLISSRHFPQLSVEGHLQITLDHATEHEADLSLYICGKLRLGDSSRANRIRETIQQKASGIFLWVVLIIRILNEDKARGKVHLLEKHLDALPEDLHHLFESVLTDTDDVTLLTFQWLLFADRPLHLGELYFAVITNNSSGDIQDWDQKDVSVAHMKNFVLDGSNGLVEVTDGILPTVQFIHGTVRDYLTNTWLPAQFALPMVATTALCHDRLWRCCHNYVLRSSPVILRMSKHGVRGSMSRCFRMAMESRSRINASHPFLEYALHGLVIHANVSHSLGVQQQDLVRGFPLSIWVRLHNLLAVNPADRMSEVVTCEYIFVTKNALPLVEAMIKHEPGARSMQHETRREKYHSLLGAAVANGHSDMVAFLLKHGAHPDSPVNGSFKCLDTATMQGNADIVRTLLDSGAAVEGSEGDLRDTQPCPLRRAAESGLTDIVRILLAHPTYAAAQWHPDMDCVLEAAIYRHDGGMIRLLHEKMSSAKRAIAGAMFAITRPRDNNANQEINIFKARHSFRTYYQGREGGEPGLLHNICRVFKDYVNGSLQTLQALHMLYPRSPAAVCTSHQVLALLKCQLLQSPASMPALMQMESRQFVLEATESAMRMVDLDWNRFFDSVDRAYHDHPVIDSIILQDNGPYGYSVHIRDSGSNMYLFDTWVNGSYGYGCSHCRIYLSKYDGDQIFGNTQKWRRGLRSELDAEEIWR